MAGSLPDPIPSSSSNSSVSYKLTDDPAVQARWNVERLTLWVEDDDPLATGQALLAVASTLREYPGDPAVRLACYQACQALTRHDSWLAAVGYEPIHLVKHGLWMIGNSVDDATTTSRGWNSHILSVIGQAMIDDIDNAQVQLAGLRVLEKVRPGLPNEHWQLVVPVVRNAFYHHAYHHEVAPRAFALLSAMGLP